MNKILMMNHSMFKNLLNYKQEICVLILNAVNSMSINFMMKIRRVISVSRQKKKLAFSVKIINILDHASLN